MGASQNFPFYVYVCVCRAGGNSTADQQGKFISPVFVGGLLCRSCFRCPLTGPKPVSEHRFRYPNTENLAHPCCGIVWCHSAPLTLILKFESLINFFLCCWFLRGLSTDYPIDAHAFSSRSNFCFACWHHLDLPDGCGAILGLT